MNTHSVSVAGLRVVLLAVQSAHARQQALPTPTAAGQVAAEGCPWVIIEREQRPGQAGSLHQCGDHREAGPGNPLGYCTGHLDAMAGEQEDWENDEEYGRRRRMLCPYQLGAGWSGEQWCPEPSDPDSEDGFCVVHNPTYDPEQPQYDEEAAIAAAGESVPCLMCDGSQPGCPMCDGRGRITLEKANQHRGAGGELSDDQDDEESRRPERVIEAWGRLREWVGEQFLVSGTTLKRRDHARWQRAESVQGLCDLTIGWLTGEIASSPGYYGPVDVDEDDAPGLTDAVVALNRIGFWTRTSQAGLDREGFDGAHWAQVAAVEGFADRSVVQRLENALAGTPYRIQAQPSREQGHERVVVTRREGRAYTGFGGSMDDEDVAIQVAGVGERAARAVENGFQIVIWDPAVGRNTLWTWLTQRFTDAGGEQS